MHKIAVRSGCGQHEAGTIHVFGGETIETESERKRESEPKNRVPTTDTIHTGVCKKKKTKFN